MDMSEWFDLQEQEVLGRTNWLVGKVASGPSLHSQCWFLVLSRLVNMILFFPRLFTCFEMGPVLQRGEESTYCRSLPLHWGWRIAIAQHSSRWRIGLICVSDICESYITNRGVSSSLSWNKVHTYGLRPDCYYCQTFAGLLTRGAFSDERSGVSFTIAAGHHHQCSHLRVQVPWDSWLYFAVSALRLPFSSPPATRRVTVEVFDPASRTR
jgi:hypothetical protein